MTHFKHLATLATLTTFLVFSACANAAVLSATTGSAANTVTDYSSAGSVSFDLDLANFNAATLRFVVGEDDLSGPLRLNMLVRNLSGQALHGLHLGLRGVGFAAAGSVTPAFGALGQVRHTAGDAQLAFAWPEWAEFAFGNPLGQAGKTDWLLDTRALAAGDSFVITADVPEPSTLALILPALCMAGLMAARRRRHD